VLQGKGHVASVASVVSAGIVIVIVVVAGVIVVVAGVIVVIIVVAIVIVVLIVIVEWLATVGAEVAIPRRPLAAPVQHGPAKHTKVVDSVNLALLAGFQRTPLGHPQTTHNQPPEKMVNGRPGPALNETHVPLLEGGRRYSLSNTGEGPTDPWAQPARTGGSQGKLADETGLGAENLHLAKSSQVTKSHTIVYYCRIPNRQPQIELIIQISCP
jgi:hypothetical protein